MVRVSRGWLNGGCVGRENLTLPGDLLSYQASGLVVGAWLESGRKELDFFAGTLVGCTGRCIKIDTHSVPFLEVCLLHCISGAMFLLMLVSQCTVHPRSLAIWITLNERRGKKLVEVAPYGRYNQ